jgi:hypothetical protein
MYSMIPPHKYLSEFAQVEAEWGVRGGRERERERKQQIKSEIWGVGQTWRRYGSEMAIRENGHLSIYINANQ